MFHRGTGALAPAVVVSPAAAGAFLSIGVCAGTSSIERDQHGKAPRWNAPRPGPPQSRHEAATEPAAWRIGDAQGRRARAAAAGLFGARRHELAYGRFEREAKWQLKRHTARLLHGQQVRQHRSRNPCQPIASRAARSGRRRLIGAILPSRAGKLRSRRPAANQRSLVKP